MKNELVKKLLPHFIALLIFLAISVLFCWPALEGKVLDQHDIAGWKGVAQNAFDYKAKHGHFPLWNTNVFSGMPNYMIAMEGKSILPNITNIMGLGLPQPVNFFFIACVCFYILCLALRTKPLIAIFGAVTFALATYNPIILSAGHVTKMFAIAFTPLLLAGLILTFEKKYWLGLAVTTLGIFLQVGANHPQISYYAFIIAAAVGVSYLVYWILKKDWKHIGFAAAITIAAVVAGLSSTALGFLTAREYSKATIRGGQNITVSGDSVISKKTEGLDTSYAFAYSLGKAEAITMLMPKAYGGGVVRDRFTGRLKEGFSYDENSAIFEKLVDRGVPAANASQFVTDIPKFWGDPESTAGGPLYAGAITCLLALIGFVLLKHPLRWGLLAVSVIGIMMALGKNLLGFNLFLFENLPLYNKFRAPSISMVIPQVTIPIAAALTLNFLLFSNNARELIQTNFKKILITMGGLTIFLVGMYLSLSYRAPFDQQLTASTGGNDEMGRLILSTLKAERKSLFGMQVLRTLGFAILLVGLLYFYMKNRISALVVGIILILTTLIDQFAVDKNYLPSDKYELKEDVEQKNFTKTAINSQILTDTGYYRVFNPGGERFSAEDFRVSTYHKAVGGYHPAKLRIYQDLIEMYFMRGIHPEILNMLNTKYIVFTNPQNGQQFLDTNRNAYGPVWLVKNVRLVKDDAEEIMTIGKTQLRDTAVVQSSYSSAVVQPQWDSAASIRISKFDNDEIEYSFNASFPQFAVFSEVFYPYGWNAYIDGKKTDYVKANYVLRGLSVPAGNHTIRFSFEPAVYKKGVKISFIGSILIAVFVLGGFFLHWREQKKKQTSAA